MVSFNEVIKNKADEHKMENEIPDIYECVRIDEILDKEFVIDIANVYTDNKSEDKRRKVALAITTVEDEKKYRIHTGASRIVEIFEFVQAHNKENPEDIINVSQGTHKIKSIQIQKGNMLILE